ncbi:MAG: TIGR03986 family CRISPR-associated RAMP protein [Syntrophomonadaceae bacterium]|jgi:CRISPR-associated protein (TIGR03986 family)|nr:TIGR03986 family CRISPR-associated RAMP protein [Syntrophomonadaceae bacterium]
MNRNYRENNKITIQTEDFVNPYNFVSLPSKCNKSVNVATNLHNDNEERFSGSIYAALETLTPLFIPNTSSNSVFPPYFFHNGNNEAEINSFDFFSYEILPQQTDLSEVYARPVIPGSSIRGAIRSAYEAVTNSCLSSCDDEDLIFYRRTTVPKTNCGLLAKTANGYVITEAEKIMLNTAGYHGKTHSFGTAFVRTNDSINIGGSVKITGDSVFVATTNNTFNTSRGFVTGLYGVQDLSDVSAVGYHSGILFLGERFQRKHHDAVFIRGTNSFPIEPEDYERFFKVWEQYQADSPGSYPNYITLNEIPVYFGKVGGTVYITPACISKEVFDAKFAALLGNHKPCASAADEICPACALFGMVSKDSYGALASRVMFQDALPDNFDYANAADFYEKPRQLPILGTPKISATEFYTEDYTDIYKVWNYDYGIKKTNGESERFTPKLRGRKFYWHKKSLTSAAQGDRADLTARIRAVSANKKFRFEIAFNRLTKPELDSLLWVLTFGDKNNIHAHKLGHGKPVGYGSVRYTVDSVTLYDLQEDLTINPVAYLFGTYDAKFVKSVPADYLRLTDFANAPKNISYPNGTRGKSSGVYQWFGLNKGNMNRLEFQQVLARPSEIKRQTEFPSQTSPVGEIRNQREAERAVRTRRRTSYDRDKIKRALGNYQLNFQSRKLLENFLANYEADPDYYKDFKGMYESVKEKYKKRNEANADFFPVRL